MVYSTFCLVCLAIIRVTKSFIPAILVTILFYLNKEQRNQGPESIQIYLTSSLNCARIHSGMQQVQEREAQLMITNTENSPGAPGSQFIITGEFHPGTECHYKLYSSFMSQNTVFGGGKWCVGILLACCSG